MQNKNYDIIIVGAGIAGRVLSVFLAQHDFSVALIDRSPIQTTVTDEFGLRVSAINHKSADLLKAINVWSAIKAKRLTPYKKMHVWNQDGALNFDASEIVRYELGYIIENQVMLAALSEKINELPIDGYEATPQMLHQFHDSVQLQLSNGERLQADLLIGADGANSWVRKTLDIETKKRSYGHTAIVATVETQRSHDNTAWQRFTKTGPLAFLPLPDDGCCSIVWSQTKERAEELLGLNNASFEQQLTQAFEGRLGKVTLKSERKSFPLIMRHAHQYIDNRVALVADAIHTIHPLAGLGLNLGLNDVKCLLETILAAQEKEIDYSSLLNLRRYQRQRKSENLMVLASMDGFNQLFSSDSEVVNWLRNKGLQTINRFSTLKQKIVKSAASV